ncbi:MAG: hypothetical protein HFE73_00485 [Firmicutes bacterium]|nr:hypothetical protein [Bacillota bacterium]
MNTVGPKEAAIKRYIQEKKMKHFVELAEKWTIKNMPKWFLFLQNGCATLFGRK